VIEKYKDVKLPPSVIYSVYKAYPGGKLLMTGSTCTQKEGDI
jgi:hypothetical protein